MTLEHLHHERQSAGLAAEDRDDGASVCSWRDARQVMEAFGVAAVDQQRCTGGLNHFIVENRYSTRRQPSPAFQLVLEALRLP